MRNIGVGDVHVPHYLETRGKALLKPFWKKIFLMQDAVDAVIYSDEVCVSHDVDIAGIEHPPLFYDKIGKLDILVIVELLAHNTRHGYFFNLFIYYRCGFVIQLN